MEEHSPSEVEDARQIRELARRTTQRHGGIPTRAIEHYTARWEYDAAAASLDKAFLKEDSK
jgi:hypothetical protein